MSQYIAFGQGLAALKVIIRSRSTEKRRVANEREKKEALTAKMRPSPAVLPVYVLNDPAVASRKVTQDPGVVRVHVNRSYFSTPPTGLPQFHLKALNVILKI